MLPSKMATNSGLFLVTIYNQSQLAQRKHVARYWSIDIAATALPLSPRHSAVTKLAVVIFGGPLFGGSHILAISSEKIIYKLLPIKGCVIWDQTQLWCITLLFTLYDLSYAVWCQCPYKCPSLEINVKKLQFIQILGPPPYLWKGWS